MVLFLFIILHINLVSTNNALNQKYELKIEYTTISVTEACQLINNTPNIVILDVRASSEYQDGYIHGAINIPHDQINDRSDELPSNFSQIILVYCQLGGRSAIASSTLTTLGYTQIYNMDEGFEAWKTADYPFEVDQASETTQSSTSDLSTSFIPYISLIFLLGMILRLKRK